MILRVKDYLLVFIIVEKTRALKWGFVKTIVVLSILG